MNMWVAIVAIVAIVMIAETWQKIARARTRQAIDDKQAGEMQARIDALEERIRVLERIVTEKKHDLKREISQL